MNLLQRLYKAQVTYVTSQKLEIKTTLFHRYFFLFFFPALILISRTIEIIFNFIPWYLSIVVFLISLQVYSTVARLFATFGNNSRHDFLLTNGNNSKNPSDYSTILKNSGFVQLFVRIQKNSVNILINNGANELAKYRLDSTTELTKVLDSLMEITNLEVVESFNTSNGEVLQLKPKNKPKQSFSSLKIGEINNIINVLSIPNPENWFSIDKDEKLIKTRNKSYEIQDIAHIIIQRNQKTVQIFLKLKNKSNKTKIFKHKPNEIIAITDVRRMNDLFQKETIFNEIELEIIN